MNTICVPILPSLPMARSLFRVRLLVGRIQDALSFAADLLLFACLFFAGRQL